MDFLLHTSSIRKALRTITMAGAIATAAATGAGAQAKTAAAPKPEPDVVVFNNGDQLTGTLESGSGNNIVFKSDVAGEVTISLDKVKELRTHGSFAVLKKNVPVTRQNTQPGKLNYADGIVKVETPAGVSSSVPEKEVAFVVTQPTFEKQLSKQSLFHGWTGAASAGATDVQATNFGTTFNAALNLVRLMPVVPYLPQHDRTIINVTEAYGKLTSPTVPQTTPVATPDSVAKTSIFHMDVEQDRYLTPRFYALGDATLDHNFAQGLDLQQVYGGGFGWTAIQSPRQQLDLKVDVHYEKQQLLPTAGTENQNLIGSTFEESYRRTLPRKLALTESGSVLPAWNNPNAYSATGNLNIALPTIHRFTVNFGASDSFINNPAVGYQKNSFQFTTGIGYTFQ